MNERWQLTENDGLGTHSKQKHHLHISEKIKLFQLNKNDHQNSCKYYKFILTSLISDSYVIQSISYQTNPHHTTPCTPIPTHPLGATTPWQSFVYDCNCWAKIIKISQKYANDIIVLGELLTNHSHWNCTSHSLIG